MPARRAPAFTTCQTALGVSPSPQIFPIRLIPRKMMPLLISAAEVQASSVCLTQPGTGTVRICLTNQVRDDAVFFAHLKILHFECDQFGAPQAAPNENR